MLAYNPNLFQEAQKSLEQPDVVQASSNPEHHIPVHPGADDDSDDEDAGTPATEANKAAPACETTEESTTQTTTKETSTPSVEPIQNLVDEPMEEG